MQKITPEISVVILCYRAEELAFQFVSEVKKSLESEGLNYELVLVANYHKGGLSSDKTPEIVRNLAKKDSTINVVAKEKKGMMGWDMRSGLEAASGRTIAVIDGDGQMPASDIIKVYKALILGNFDMAKTYRVARGDGTLRLIISVVFNIMVKILFPKVKVKDINSKPKIFTREAYEKLQLASDRWFIDAEIIIQASYQNFKITEVPTVFHINRHRASFIRFGAVVEFLFDLIHYRILWRKTFNDKIFQ